MPVRLRVLVIMQLVDRDVIPILGPMREAMGLELVSCENERC